MATSRNAFNEVRGLLNRMERSIDEARDRRLGRDDPAPDSPAARRLPGRADLDTVIGVGEGDQPVQPQNGAAHAAHAEQPAAQDQTPPSSVSENRAKYGRAQPLRRPSTPSGEWKS